MSFHKGKNGKWSRTFSCKRCGEIGHVAKNCIGDKLMALDVAAEVDGVETEPLQFPTLQVTRLVYEIVVEFSWDWFETRLCPLT